MPIHRRTLALETSGTRGSVAALVGDELLAELPLNPAQRSAQSLAPALVELLALVDWRSKDVEVVAVAAGPGSFTGLRIGVTTAKTFAYAVGADVVAVNTLEVLAAQATSAGERLSAAIDAQRRQVCAASFVRGGEGWFDFAAPPAIGDLDQWLAGLAQGSWVTGPVLEKLADRLPAGVTPVGPAEWTPRASAVGRLAARRYSRGQRDDLWSLVPQYYRASAAEEKRARATGPNDETSA